MTSNSGFGWEFSPIWTSLNCKMDLSKFYVLFALCQKKVGLSLIKIPKLFKTSALNERCWMSQSSQCLGSVVPLAMYQDQSWDQIFLRLLLKHFMIQNLFKMLLVSIWKMIPAQLELEEYQIALKISILKFVKYQDFFLRPLQNFFVTNTATFLRPKFSRLIPRLFFETDT